MLRLQRLIRGVPAERPEEPEEGGGAIPVLRRGFPRPALPDLTAVRFFRTPSASRLRMAALAFLPTILGVVYFGALAAPRYVSEAKFVVRTPSKPAGNLNFGSLLQMTGLGQSDDDAYSVEDYLQSREALRQMEKKLPLRRMYKLRGADFVARYPSIFYGSTDEEFYRYFQWMLSVVHDPSSGITTVKVEAFSPQDAHTILQTMLRLGEQMVNRLNARISEDSIRVAQAEVNSSEQRLVQTELALTDFRNRELLIDPVANSVIESKVEGELGGEQSQVEAQIGAMRASSPDNPRIAALQKQADALRSQIVKERQLVSKGAGVDKGGLADQLSQYERLVLNREFAKKMLETATAALEAAKSDARRQQLYLERVVDPNMPDFPTEPERLRTIVTIFAFNLIFLLVATTIITGVREHQAGRRHSV